MPSSPSQLNREILAREVEALLETKPGAHNIYGSQAMKIVDAVLDSIKRALLCGESVHIQGLGHFVVKTSYLTNRKVNDFRGFKLGPAYYIKKRPRPIVKFYPTRSVIAPLNSEVPHAPQP